MEIERGRGGEREREREKERERVRLKEENRREMEEIATHSYRGEPIIGRLRNRLTD